MGKKELRFLITGLCTNYCQNRQNCVVVISKGIRVNDTQKVSSLHEHVQMYCKTIKTAKTTLLYVLEKKTVEDIYINNNTKTQIYFNL